MIKDIRQILPILLCIVAGVIVAAIFGVGAGIVYTPYPASAAEEAPSDAMQCVVHKRAGEIYITICEFSTTKGAPCVVVQSHNGLALACDWDRHK